VVVKETITAAELLERLRFFEVEAEKAYGRMYDARPGSDLAACYSDAKEASTRRRVCAAAWAFPRDGAA
jgi:hypothetical protein